MQNQYLPQRGEVYLGYRNSIIASKKLSQNHMLAYNSFPSRAYPETIKEGKQIRQEIGIHIVSN